MPQDLRIEHPEHTSFITTRTAHSRIWFQNNRKLQNLINAHLAKYQEVYEVKIYFFVLMGNHYHLGADFPKMNRAHFMRDFNTMISKLTGSHVAEHPGGSLWGRRYRSQALVRDEDREKYFLYAALNPVSSGLVRRLSDYNQFGYNSCFDAIQGIEREYKIINWTRYRDKVRYDKSLRPEDFEEIYTLTYSRLPGYDEYSQDEYAKTFREKIAHEQQRIVEERVAAKRGFAGKDVLRKTKPGTLPRSTKTSGRYDKRPLILTACKDTKKAYLDFYFAVRSSFTECYEMLREGIKEVVFPYGTYHPPLGWVSA